MIMDAGISKAISPTLRCFSAMAPRPAPLTSNMKCKGKNKKRRKKEKGKKSI